MSRTDYLTEQQLYDDYQIKPRTAQRWRQTGEGPAYIRLGRRRILYARQDIEQWLGDRTFRHHAEEAARETERVLARAAGAQRRRQERTP